MKFLAGCWIIAAMLAGPAAVYAGGCRSVVIHKQATFVETPIVAAVAAVVPIVAKFVEYPIYNTQFYPTQQYIPSAVGGGVGVAAGSYAQGAYGAAGPQAAPCADLAKGFKQIADAMLQLDDRLNRLEGGTQPRLKINPMTGADGNPAPAPQPQAQPGAQAGGAPTFTVRSCAACHEKTSAASKGGNFIILDNGQFSQSLTPEGAGKILERLTTRDPKKVMPPPPLPRPTAEERLNIIEELAVSK